MSKRQQGTERVRYRWCGRQSRGHERRLKFPVLPVELVTTAAAGAGIASTGRTGAIGISTPFLMGTLTMVVPTSNIPTG
jgi:hypothetical protein